MVGFYSLEGPGFNGTGLNVQLFHMRKAPNQSFCNPNACSWKLLIQAILIQLDNTISFRAFMLVQINIKNA